MMFGLIPVVSQQVGWYRAMDTDGDGLLMFEDLLVGMLAVDPATPNEGAWRSKRSELIFRVRGRRPAHARGRYRRLAPIWPTNQPSLGHVGESKIAALCH
jgi:hypothetical protein